MDEPGTRRQDVGMNRQVLTCALERAALERELDEIVRYFSERGLHSCRILFGFAWGNAYYPEPAWQDEEILFSDLRRKVGEVEASGIGRIGRDDLFVTVDDIEFQFCHDSDLHIHFDRPGNAHVEAFFSRWQALGYAPAEWVRTGASGPGERVR
jgi:hypothetical protein